MFTGITTNIAPVTGQQKLPGGLRLTFKRPGTWTDLELGESIATDGVCLTVSAIRAGEYDCDLVPETLNRTTFGRHVPAAVNLERSMRMHDRFGGHFVQGHADGIGVVAKVDKTNGHYLSITFPKESQELVIQKGSITINGVALTVTDVGNGTLSVALIPHTLKYTTLGTLKVGNEVNLEFDMIGKYIANLLRQRGNHAAR